MTHQERLQACIDAMLEGDRLIQEFRRLRAELQLVTRSAARGSLARTQLPPESRTVVSAGVLPPSEPAPDASTIPRRR